MQTDPVVTVVFFSVGFLVFCGVAAAVMHVVEWRDRVDAARRAHRAKVLVARIERYGNPKSSAPDFVPADWEAEAA